MTNLSLPLSRAYLILDARFGAINIDTKLNQAGFKEHLDKSLLRTDDIDKWKTMLNNAI